MLFKSPISARFGFAVNVQRIFSREKANYRKALLDRSSLFAPMQTSEGFVLA